MSGGGPGDAGRESRSTPVPAPVGMRLVPDAGLRRIDSGRVLIGGSPLRIVRLSDAGAAVFDAWADGTPLADVGAARRLARRLLDAGMVHPRPRPPDPATGPGDRRMAVVVPCRDDTAALTRLLPTIAGPAVVVDEGSRDPEGLACLVASHPDVSIVRSARPEGPGAARMRGVDHGRDGDAPDPDPDDIVVFVDADVVLPDGWWPPLAAHFDDPAVVAVAPRVCSRPGPTLRERYEAEHSPLDMGPAPANVGPGRAVAYVPTAVLAVRRCALAAVGGFDARLRIGEDVDLVWRLVGAGGTVRYAPEVVVHHAPRPGWAALARQRFRYGTSAVELTRRHGRLVAPARCSRWSLAAWGLTAAGRPLAGLGVAAGSSAALVPKLRDLPDAGREAFRLAGWGHAQSGLGLARAVTRVWWPVGLLSAWRWRRVRAAVAAAFVVPALLDWWRGRRPTDPVRSVGLRVADDMIYGAGVWWAGVRRRDLRALRPDIVEWPGARRAVSSLTDA